MLLAILVLTGLLVMAAIVWGRSDRPPMPDDDEDDNDVTGSDANFGKSLMGDNDNFGKGL